jgi:hypothetical protein
VKKFSPYIGLFPSWGELEDTSLGPLKRLTTIIRRWIWNW